MWRRQTNLMHFMHENSYRHCHSMDASNTSVCRSYYSMNFSNIYNSSNFVCVCCDRKFILNEHYEFYFCMTSVIYLRHLSTRIFIIIKNPFKTIDNLAKKQLKPYWLHYIDVCQCQPTDITLVQLMGFDHHHFTPLIAFF